MVYNFALMCLVPASSSANASAYNWSSSFLYFLAVGGRLSFNLSNESASMFAFCKGCVA